MTCKFLQFKFISSCYIQRIKVKISAYPYDFTAIKHNNYNLSSAVDKSYLHIIYLDSKVQTVPLRRSRLSRTSRLSGPGGRPGRQGRTSGPPAPLVRTDTRRRRPTSGATPGRPAKKHCRAMLFLAGRPRTSG